MYIILFITHLFGGYYQVFLALLTCQSTMIMKSSCIRSSVCPSMCQNFYIFNFSNTVNQIVLFVPTVDLCQVCEPGVTAIIFGVLQVDFLDKSANFWQISVPNNLMWSNVHSTSMKPQISITKPPEGGLVIDIYDETEPLWKIGLRTPNALLY